MKEPYGLPAKFPCLWPASLARLLVQHDGLHAARDDFFIDETLFDVSLRRNGVHEIEHQLLEDDAQAARADLALQGFARDRDQRLVGELELDPLELEDGLVLPDEAVLGLVEDA